MDNIWEQSLLYDFYGELLTKHQQIIYEYAVFQDMSLSEIAVEEGISRQGVHDILKRCTSILENYEKKLGLVAKFTGTKERVVKIRAIAAGAMQKPDPADMEEIERLAQEILEL